VEAEEVIITIIVEEAPSTEGAIPILGIRTTMVGVEDEVAEAVEGGRTRMERQLDGVTATALSSKPQFNLEIIVGRRKVQRMPTVTIVVALVATATLAIITQMAWLIPETLKTGSLLSLKTSGRRVICSPLATLESILTNMRIFP
jgi:hypothetical protein